MCRLASNRPIEAVVIDPSAASFMECIRRHGVFRVLPAKNDVLPGIRRVSDALAAGRLRFSRSCEDIIREFALYSYGTDGAELPRKEHYHAMDDLRYFVSTILDAPPVDAFFAQSLPRL